MFKLSILSCVAIFTTFVNFDRINGHSIGNYGQELSRSGTLEQNDLQLGLNNARSKRALYNFYTVLECVIVNNCHPFDYNSHGCFCGFGGSGIPMDDVDRCCQIHDECYNETACSWFTEKLWPYSWACQRKKPICDFNDDKKHEDLTCGEQLCKCDRDFALCISKFPCPDKKKECDLNDSSFFKTIK